MTQPEDGFGSYLEKVEERDIDLLLMEEFHVSEQFVTWFCEKINLPDADFDGAWHSVTNADGETDLLLRVHAGDRRVGVLIENKIAAAEQVDQDVRYHLRAARAQNEGKFDSFVVCIWAPQIYLDGLGEDSRFQYRIPYEAIASWYANQSGPRATWRNRIMNEAVVQGRRGYSMIVNEATSRFHHDYWEYLVRKHPVLRMNKPTPKGSKSTWIIMKAHNFPKGVKLHHKLDQCVVELGFENHSLAELIDLRADWPDGIRPIPKGASGRATLAISVPKIEMGAGVTAQEKLVEAALQAAHRLLPYATLFQERPKIFADKMK